MEGHVAAQRVDAVGSREQTDGLVDGLGRQVGIALRQVLTENLAEHDLRVGLAVFLRNLRADGVRVPQRPQPLQRRQLELGLRAPAARHVRARPPRPSRRT